MLALIAQDEKAIRSAENNHEDHSSKPLKSEAGRQFQNDIISQGELPDAMEEL